MVENADDNSLKILKQTILTQIILLKTEATTALQQTQKRYKTDFDLVDNQNFRKVTTFMMTGYRE